MAGFEVHRGKLRVYFQYKDEKCREPFGPDTPENRNRAKAFAQVLDYELSSGTFNYARHFPNSKRVACNTFGHYLDEWLKSKEREVAASFIRSYRNKSNRHIRPKWGDRQIHTIEHLELRNWIADHVGHSSIQMIQQRYGKWIHADGPDIHKAVEKLLGL